MHFASLPPWIALLVSVALPCPLLHGQATPLTLRVLTYNIHHGEGTDRRIDLGRIASVIQSATPDLVALQEVDKETARTNGVDQAARLGELTGLHSLFGKAMDYKGGAYGVALLSKWPLVEPRTFPLPSDPGIEPRVVLRANVQPEATAPPLSFFVTHLDHRADPVQRTRQAEKLRGLFPPDAKPAILAGDFNAVPDSSVMKGMLREWSDSAEAARLLTSPAHKPLRKIDYILYRPAASWRVIETIAIDEPVASDHRPVLAVIELAPPK